MHAAEFPGDCNARGGSGETRILAGNLDAEGITADAALGTGPVTSVLRLALDPRADLAARDRCGDVPKDRPADRQHDHRKHRHIKADAAVSLWMSLNICHYDSGLNLDRRCYRTAENRSEPAGMPGDVV